MCRRGSLWLAGQAICLSSLFVASQAGAVRQGPLGPTSAGSVGITVSIASRARISELKDIRFDPSARSQSETSRKLCFPRETMAHSFEISATGSGNGGALVLSRRGGGPRLSLALRDGEPGPDDGALARRAPDNAMRPMLPLFESLAARSPRCTLKAGPGRVLDVEILHG